jgi:hypothetical protein
MMMEFHQNSLHTYHFSKLRRDFEHRWQKVLLPLISLSLHAECTIEIETNLENTHPPLDLLLLKVNGRPSLDVRRRLPHLCSSRARILPHVPCPHPAQAPLPTSVAGPAPRTGNPRGLTHACVLAQCLRPSQDRAPHGKPTWVDSWLRPSSSDNHPLTFETFAIYV